MAGLFFFFRPVVAVGVDEVCAEDLAVGFAVRVARVVSIRTIKDGPPFPLSAAVNARPAFALDRPVVAIN